jgi:putative PIG3 family NAD(P)H quinone oxidoreductase
MMHAVTVPVPGGPDALTPGQVPVPEVGERDVLIEVAAAGVNGADVAQRRGAYPSPAGAPHWPGLEVSGIVAAVGASARAFTVGDRVCALIPGGGYAERVAADERLVLPVPNGVGLVQAAGLPEVAATVWSNVFDLGRLRPGESLLVHGGSSGIGSMAIQLGVALGSPVFATAGSDEKVAFCERLGATGINYRTEDFVQRATAATGGRGIDVVLDMVAGDYLDRDIRTLAVGGRIMVIATRGGTRSSVDVGALMGRRGSISATTLRARPLEERAAIIAGVREHVWPLIEAGRVRPIIDSLFPLDSAAGAHRRMESSAHLGKILLAVRPGPYGDAADEIRRDL